MKKIVVIDTTFAVVEREPEKVRLARDLNTKVFKSRASLDLCNTGAALN